MTAIRRIFGVARWGFFALGLLVVVALLMLSVPLSRPPELASIQTGSAAIDRTGMPDPLRFQARDGSSLAYRFYPAANSDMERIVIAIHGSSGASFGVNAIAKRLAAENIAVVAPDMRGHGGSGTRGDIAYLGQLDDDLDDLIAELRREHPTTLHFELLGFSAGGGFALRVASDKLATTFDRVVLLSPYLGYNALSTRNSRDTARWADVDLPRLVVLSLLHRLGLTWCESLPVIAFAVSPTSQDIHTTQYSYRLIMNFTAPAALDAAFSKLSTSTTIIAGAQDELMFADKYAEIVRGIEPRIDVKIMPGLDHMDMMNAPAALDAIAAVFKK